MAVGCMGCTSYPLFTIVTRTVSPSRTTVGSM